MKSEKFAKLFESDEVGQILVRKDFEIDVNYSVRFTGFYESGVVSMGLNFPFTESGKEQMNSCFEKIDIETVLRIVQSEMSAFAELFEGEEVSNPASVGVEHYHGGDQ